MIILCVLKGSYKFFTHLVDELIVARNSCKTHFKIEFIRIESYKNTSSSETLQIIGLSNLNDLTKKNILVKTLILLILFKIDFRLSKI